MANTEETYEKLRQLLSPNVPGFAPLPKHPLTDKLLRNMYSENEAEFLTACEKRRGRCPLGSQTQG